MLCALFGGVRAGAAGPALGGVLGGRALHELGRAARAPPLLPGGLVFRRRLDARQGPRGVRLAGARDARVPRRVARRARNPRARLARRPRARRVRDRRRAAHHPRGGAALVHRDVRAPRAAVHRPAHLPRHVQPRVLTTCTTRTRATTRASASTSGSSATRSSRGRGSRRSGLLWWLRGARTTTRRRTRPCSLHVVRLRLRALLVHGDEVSPLHLPGRAAGRDAHRRRARRHARPGAARATRVAAAVPRGSRRGRCAGGARRRAHAARLVLRVEARRSPRADRVALCDGRSCAVRRGSGVAVVVAGASRCTARRDRGERGDAAEASRAERRGHGAHASRMLAAGAAAAALLLVVVGARSHHQARGRGPAGRDPAPSALHVQLPARAGPTSLDFSAALAGFTAVVAVALRWRSRCGACGGTRWPRCARSRSSGASGASTSTWRRRRRTGASTRSSRPTTPTAPRPTKMLVAYQMNWKGENFYTGNHVPAFVSTGSTFTTWLKKQRETGVKVMYFITEHGRIGGLKSEVRREDLPRGHRQGALQQVRPGPRRALTFRERRTGGTVLRPLLVARVRSSSARLASGLGTRGTVPQPTAAPDCPEADRPEASSHPAPPAPIAKIVSLHTIHGDLAGSPG